MAPRRSNDFQQPSEDRPIIATSKNIAVPLWVVGILVFGAISVTSWMASTLHGIHTELANMNRMLAGGWRTEHQREFAHRLAKENPNLKVPDTYEIIKTVP